MKKVILIDGNNILFRSYYATAYSGNFMKTSTNFPTNALYGFVNMINKIIKEEKPNYIMMAFDKGKTFRHEKYDHYKEGRIKMPDELKMQFPRAKELSLAMGIPYFEIDNYEADDIIGTFSKEVDRNEDFIATIISSDKDLLQLISNDVEVKLLKTHDYIRMDEKEFVNTYGVKPIRMIDLKALMGDQSDNIPGVRGIGEKTALKLLQEYDTIENLYDNIDKITGKTKEKLLTDKDNAFFSKELATIYKEVPIDVDLEKIKYTGYTDQYIDLLKEFEFYSLLKKEQNNIEIKQNVNNSYVTIDDISLLTLDKPYSIYLEVCGNYHDKNVFGAFLCDGDKTYYIPYEVLKKNPNIFNTDIKKYTYDLKKILVSLKYIGGNIKNCDDIMLALYLENKVIKDDVSFILSNNGFNVLSEQELYKKKELKDEDIINNSISIVKGIDSIKDISLNTMSVEHKKIYDNIDLPVTSVLADMEYEGVTISKDVLLSMREEVKEKMDEISKNIYNIAGREFNIMSPLQLANVLFVELNIPYPKKIKDNKFSTSADILEKLRNYEIVKLVLEYRMLAKIYSNYIVGLMDQIKSDGKIHTIFTQTLTRTGRLSSISPNLQNIPIRTSYGRLIRRAFIPRENSVILSSDYSQIELRVFASLSNEQSLINAFKSGIDIHTKTAMDIFNLNEGEVTKDLRRQAKAVNFGILYGISSFGLSEDLGIDVSSAKSFIDNYLNTYKGIKNYNEGVINEAKKNGYVKTLFGRTRILEELNNTNYLIRSQGERMAQNTPIQGTSADIIKLAMIKIYKEFEKLGLKSKMIIQVHDELVFDVLNDELEVVKDIVKNTMENVCELNVPLEVDVEIGCDWYEAK